MISIAYPRPGKKDVTGTSIMWHAEGCTCTKLVATTRNMRQSSFQLNRWGREYLKWGPGGADKGEAVNALELYTNKFKAGLY